MGVNAKLHRIKSRSETMRVNEDIIISEMLEDGDMNRAAQLIFETAPELFIALFGRKEKAVPKIEALVKLENNIFSYKNILTAETGGNISGILVGYDVASVNKEDMNEDLKKELSFFARLRFWMIIRFSRHIMDFEGITGCYIQNLCVDPACRGKRIGYRLMEQYIAACGEKRIENVYLDVEAENEAAVNLYKKTGFEIFRTTNIKIAGVTLFRMRRVIEQS